MADRFYLPRPKFAFGMCQLVTVPRTEVIQEDCTVHMTDKDCAPSPEIACKMLPCDFSANNEASQEDMFACSIAT